MIKSRYKNCRYKLCCSLYVFFIHYHKNKLAVSTSRSISNMFETVKKNLMNIIPLGTYCKSNQFTIIKNMIHPYRIFMFIDHVYEAKTGFWFGKTHLFQSIKFANLWKKLHFFFLCISLKPNYMYNTRPDKLFGLHLALSNYGR